MKELFFPVILSLFTIREAIKDRHLSKDSSDLAQEFMSNVLKLEIGELDNSIGVIISPKTLSVLKDSARIGFELASVITNNGELVIESFPSITPPPELPSDLTWKELLDDMARVLRTTLPIMEPDKFLHLFTDAALGLGSKEWSTSQAGNIFIYCSLGLSLSIAIASKELRILEEEEC